MKLPQAEFSFTSTTTLFTELLLSPSVGLFREDAKSKEPASENVYKNSISRFQKHIYYGEYHAKLHSALDARQTKRAYHSHAYKRTTTDQTGFSAVHSD